MAAYRYGQIIHGDYQKINLRFESAQERDAFRRAFEAHHASHDHDGKVPIFMDTTAKDANSSYSSGVRTHGTIHPVKCVVLENGEYVIDTDEQVEYVTIDGYTQGEIKDYHNPTGMLETSWYTPPTTMEPPIIVVDDTFVDSNILQRHPLSAIFGDMPAEDFQSLRTSVQQDGFIENVVRIYEGQILDGWHRYRAGRELNLLRKLKFQEWDADENQDGDPKTFVLARNIERRHLTPGQRAQIAVAFNERFGHGGDRNSPNGDLKNRTELAEQAGVGTSTIDRAIAIEKAGRSTEVIAGKKTAGEVLADAKQRRANCKKALVAIMREKGTLLDTDSAALAAEYQISPADALKLLSQVQFDENKKARLRWQDAYTAVRTNYMNYKALSKNVDWEDFTAAAIAQTDDFPSLSADTFTDADNRVKDCEGYLLLQREGDDLLSLSRSIREAADRPSLDSFVNALIPDDVREAAQIVKHWERIDARLPQWKKRLPVENQDVPVDKFTKDLLITVFREVAAERQKDTNFMTFEIGEPGTPLSLHEVDELRCRIQNETYWLIYEVRKALLSSAITPEEGEHTEAERNEKRKLSAAAEHRMWKVLEEVAPEWNIDDFIAAACDKHSDWGVSEFPHTEDTDIPEIWEARFNLLSVEIEQPSDWVQSMLDKMSEPPAHPTETDTSETDLGEAYEDAQQALQQMWETFENSAYAHQISRQDFALAAAKHYGLYKDNDYGSGENYLMEEPFALLENLGTLNAVRKWKEFIGTVRVATQIGADWITALIEDPITGDSEPESEEQAVSVQSDTEQIHEMLTHIEDKVNGTETITLTGIRIYFDETVDGQEHPNRRSIEFGNSTIAQGTLDELPLMVKTLLMDAVKEK